MNLSLLGCTTTDEAIEFLLDSANWSLLEDKNFADYAQGAPTLEMYVSCWNVRHPDSDEDIEDDLFAVSIGSQPASTFMMWVAYN